MRAGGGTGPRPTGRSSRSRTTAPGIPEDQLERIFERFHQVDGSASREHGGTGLGLALARELARLHGGNVLVRSRLEEGAAFRVEMPRDPGVALVERRRRPRRREDQLVQFRSDAQAAREYALRSMRETLLADVDLPRRVSEDAAPAAAGRSPRACCWSRTTPTCGASSPPASPAATGWRPPRTAPPASRRRGAAGPTWWSPT